MGSLLVPSAALAEQYTVQLCLQPGGGAGESADIEAVGGAPFSVTRRCEAAEPPAVRGVRITAGSGATGDLGLQVTAPSGTRILSARIFHYTQLPAGAVLRAIVRRDGTESVVQSWTGGTHGSTAQESAQGDAYDVPLGGAAEAVRYEVACPAACEGLDARLYSVVLQLEDVANPAVSLQARIEGGVIDADVDASDAGSGLASLRLLVNGQQVESRTLTCAKRISPCPTTQGTSFAPSWEALPDGVHRVRVEARDHSDNSAAAEADVLLDRDAPIPLGAPGIVGTPEVGQTLVAAAGAWSGQSHTVAYRWERCRGGSCVPIPHSSGASYAVREEDQEHELRVVEIASDGGGTAEQRSTLAPPVPPQVPVLIEPLALGGEERVGGRLAAVAGTWQNAVALRYQWLSCSRRDGGDCIALPGRERPFLDIERDDVGRYLVLVVTATGPRGHTAQASAASARIPSPPLRNLTEPSVGGTATVGGRLTVETGGWEGAGLRYEIQWLRCTLSGCLPIPGAISRIYEPTSKDLGATLVALVTARDVVGEALPIRSRPSEVVRSKAATRALAVPRVRTRVRIVSFGDYQFALTIGPTLQVLDVSKNSRVDVLCRLCARARLGRRSKVRGGSVKFKLPSDGVQIPPGGQIVVRVRRKGAIGREIIGTLSLDRSRRVSWSSPRCTAKDGSLRTVSCPASKKQSKKKATAKRKGKRGSTKKSSGKTRSTTRSQGTSGVETTESAGLAVPVQ